MWLYWGGTLWFWTVRPTARLPSASGGWRTERRSQSRSASTCSPTALCSSQRWKVVKTNQMKGSTSALPRTNMDLFSAREPAWLSQVSCIGGFALICVTIAQMSFEIKGIVHPKMNICWKCTHPQIIQDVDGFVSSSDLEKCSIASLTTFTWTSIIQF